MIKIFSTALERLTDQTRPTDILRKTRTMIVLVYPSNNQVSNSCHYKKEKFSKIVNFFSGLVFLSPKTAAVAPEMTVDVSDDLTDSQLCAMDWSSQFPQESR